MRSLLALAVAVAFAAPIAAAAADAPAPVKPIRHLVYDISYSAYSTHQAKSSGFNGAYGGGSPAAGSPSGGSGTLSQAMNGDERGLLTIDVVAAPADGGLVVDTTFTGPTNAQPTTRVAIYKDGRIVSDPAHPLAPETTRLLPLIARGFIAERDVSAGSSWVVPAAAPAKGSTTYRVESSDGHLARIAIEGTWTVSGPAGFDEADQGVTTYATDLASPVSYDLIARIHRQFGTDSSLTTNAHLTAKLITDSLAKT